MMITAGMAGGALAQAKREVYDVCATGGILTIYPASSTDKFGEETGTPTGINLNVFPVRMAPFSRKLASAVSWTDHVDAIAYVSKHGLDLIPLSLQKLKTYKNAKYNGQKYTIDQCENYLPFADDFLYVLVGLKK